MQFVFDACEVYQLLLQYDLNHFIYKNNKYNV